LIVIEMEEIKTEAGEFSIFLKQKLHIEITVHSSRLILDEGGKELAIKVVKAYAKRFLHSRGISELYRVTESGGVIRFVKRSKDRNARKHGKEGMKPSSYTTLPYYYPNYP